MVETMESAERNYEARFVSATAKCDAGCIRVTFSGDLHKPETFVPLSVKRHSIMGTLASLVHALQCQWLFLLQFSCLPVHFSRLHPWVHDNTHDPRKLAFRFVNRFIFFSSPVGRISRLRIAVHRI